MQSQVSISSNITGLRSVKSDDEEPPSWGDMDPELVQRLQADPEAMKVFMATRRPRKETRLDPSLGQFSMTTDVPLPPAPSSSTQTPEIGKETIKEAFQEYHSTVVGPALAEIHSHVANNIAPQIRTLETNNTLLKASLSSVKFELHKRTLLKHGVPPFCGKKAIDDNMWYLLKVAELAHVDIQSVSNHLLTSTTSFIRIVFLTEAMAKQFFQNFRMSKRYFRNRDPKNYIADTPIKIERDLSLTERLERQPLYALVDSRCA